VSPTSVASSRKSRQYEMLSPAAASRVIDHGELLLARISHTTKSQRTQRPKNTKPGPFFCSPSFRLKKPDQVQGRKRFLLNDTLPALWQDSIALSSYGPLRITASFFACCSRENSIGAASATGNTPSRNSLKNASRLRAMASSASNSQ